MLRALVALLLLANIAFFAWARGWLGAPPHHAEREPERLLAQVRPEVLTVLPPGSATVAVQAARAAALQCLETGPFADSAIGAAEAALSLALASASLPDGSWARVDGAASTPAWLVFAGRYPETALRKSREDDLRKLNLGFELITAPPELAPGLVLSRHTTRDEAQAWLNARSGTPLRGARVLQLPAPPAAYRLRVARAEPDLAERLKALPTDALAGGFRPCATKP